MRTLAFITTLTMFIIFTACKDNNTAESADTGSTQDTITTESRPQAIPVYTWVNKLRLRTQPDSKSEILMELPEGSTLYFLGEKSDKTEKVTLRGETFDEPWLRVGTADGTKGWVYGGAVRFNAPKVDKNPSPYDDCYRQLHEKDYNVFNNCSKKVQKKQLKKDQRYITQLGKGLSINLLSGENKVLKPEKVENLGDNGFSEYNYYYYIPQMGFFVVEAIGYEYYQFQLINDKSGRATPVWGYPKPSPDFRHLIVTNADLEAGFTPNGIQIFGFTDDGFKLLWEKELTDKKPSLPKWLDEKTVEITLSSPDHEENPEEETFELTIENGKVTM